MCDDCYGDCDMVEEVQASHERIERLEADLEVAADNFKRAEAESAMRADRLKFLNTANINLAGSNEEMRNELRQLRAANADLMKSRGVERVRNRDLAEDVASLNRECDRWQRANLERDGQITKLVAEVGSLKDELAGLTGERDYWQGEVGALKKIVNAQAATEQAGPFAKSGYETQITALNQEVSKLRRENAALRTDAGERERALADEIKAHTSTARRAKANHDVIVELRRQLVSAPTPQSLTTLKVKLDAANTVIRDLHQAFEGLDEYVDNTFDRED